MIRVAILLLMLIGFAGSVSASRREFLRPQEISSIQDEQDSGKRVLLYLQFALRRLDAVKDAANEPGTGKEIQRELEEYNSMLDALADALENARNQRSSVGKAIKEMETQGAASLRYLRTLQASASADASDYQFTLEEAIATTNDMIAEAKKGAFPEVKERKAPVDLPASPKEAAKRSAPNPPEEGPPRKKSRSSSQKQ